MNNYYYNKMGTILENLLVYKNVILQHQIMHKFENEMLNLQAKKLLFMKNI
jgi:hypothetical protein